MTPPMKIGRGRSLPIILASAVAALLFTACSSGGDATKASPEPVDATSTVTAGDCDPARTVTPGERAFALGEDERSYLLALPDDYDGTTRAPLVLDLHGFTATAQRHDSTSRLSERGTARGYVVVTPNAGLAEVVPGSPLPLWNYTAAFADTSAIDTEAKPPPGDDVAFLNALVDSLEEELCVDHTREYVTGFSAGAGMSTWLACQPGSRFAAFAPLAGMNHIKSCPSGRTAPFLVVHGDQDAYGGGDLAGFPLDIPGVEEQAERFAVAQDCGSAPSVTVVSPVAVHRVWPCPHGSGAELYTIIGGTHSYPGDPNADVATRSFDAVPIILAFFDQHSLG